MAMAVAVAEAEDVRGGMGRSPPSLIAPPVRWRAGVEAGGGGRDTDDAVPGLGLDINKGVLGLGIDDGDGGDVTWGAPTLTF